jgi:hypothetical protein
VARFDVVPGMRGGVQLGVIRCDGTALSSVALDCGWNTRWLRRSVAELERLRA